MKNLLHATLITSVICFLYSCSINNQKKVESLTGNDLVNRGKYLVTVGGCNDCHSPKIMTQQGPMVDTNRALSGYPSDKPLAQLKHTEMINEGWNVFNSDLTATIGMWGASFAANITSDQTGIGNWTEEQFRKAFTQGKYMGIDNGRMLLPPMPWQDFSKMKDEDVKAVFAYLKSTKPVKNAVPFPISLKDIK